MHSTRKKRVRPGTAWLVAALVGADLLLAAASASAQTASPIPESPADALARNLRSLAQDPKNVSALMGAGTSALQVGDAQAALTFFARAEEQTPRDGRIKMWMGAALVQLEQPQAAMNFFREAVALGVPEAEVAKDRGLAWDILGDPRRAQHDYQLALRRAADPEVTRRLALSLGISGEREKALRLLEEQLLVQDRAAQRTRALILALTGDTAGATRAAEQSMPAGQAAMMTPFLARLPSLSLADRALAVHLGRFPTPGGAPAPAYSPPPVYAANTAPAPPPRGTTPAQPNSAGRSASPPPAPVDTSRRRPGSEERPTSVGRALAGYSIAAAPPQAPPSSTRPAPDRTEPARREPVQVAQARPSAPPPAGQQPSAPISRRPEPGFSQVAPAASRPTELAQSGPPPSSVAARPSAPERTKEPPARIEPARKPPTRIAEANAPRPEKAPAPRSRRVADLANVVADLDEPAPARRGKGAAAGREAVPTQTARPAKCAKGRKCETAAKAKKAVPEDPSRVWVQVSGGARKDDLPRAYAGVKAKAPKLLKGRTAWTTATRASNRVLVGPFKSEDEAQDFVNKLAGSNVGAFTFTSESGQKVERLPPE